MRYLVGSLSGMVKTKIIHTMLCGQPPRQVLAYVYDWYGYLTGQILLSP